MSLSQALIAEFKVEAANTRKYLEACPEDKFDWQPHEKSMPLGKLAAHLADNPIWASWMVSDALDFADMGDYKAFEPTSSEELLAGYDERVRIFNETVAGISDEQFQEEWTMRQGEQVFMRTSRAVAFRTWLFSHMIHHRGQLSVYLRLLDVPVPKTYGPTADDQGF